VKTSIEHQQNPQLTLAQSFVEYTNKTIFLTGKAGTGKTTFLHNLKKNSPKRLIVVAPTGVAAINAGGVTIHSFFQMPFGPQIPEDSEKTHNESSIDKGFAPSFLKISREKINIMKSMDMLVIDEISMVRADLLDGIDQVLRRFRDKTKPFGGVQLLMIGDIQQLAPVAKEEEWSILKEYYDTPYFFSSKALQKTSYVSIELTTIYRQSDSIFIDILNKVRDNTIDKATLEAINKRYIPGFAQKNNDGYIMLTTHNYLAKNSNESRLQLLSTIEKVYHAAIDGDFPEYSYPTEKELIIKEGAQVMFIKNDISPQKSYYNGKIGKVVAIKEETIFVQCNEDNSVIPVQIAEWQNMKYTVNKETATIQENVIGTFKQYPLKLAWAITIHKSQGLTFEKAIIDANSSFSHGQVYVALSRCKSLEGVVLNTPISFNSIKTDTTVKSFVQRVQENYPDEKTLEQSKLDYEKELLYDLFSFENLQKKAGNLQYVISENSHLFTTEILQNSNKCCSEIRNSIQDVAVKFKARLHNLLLEEPDILKNTALKIQIEKASDYFLEKIVLINEIFAAMEKIDIDNKSVRKSTHDAIDKVINILRVKIACLTECKTEFTVKKYLDVRAKASLKQQDTKTAKSVSDKEFNEEKKYPDLYDRLKKWRYQKANDDDVAPFMILPQKTMILLTNITPVTTGALEEIHGMGKKKIAKYGKELLEIISSYVNENNVTPATWVEKDVVQVPKGNSKVISFELFKTGKTVDEISLERGLSKTTIEEHLSHFVGSGELDISAFVSSDKVSMICDYFSKAENLLISPAKEALGEQVTYSDLRFVQKYYSNMITKK
jgi:hypothetical protein